MPAKALPVKLVAESVFSELVDAGAIHTLYVLEESHGRFHIQGRADAYDYQIRLKRGGTRTFRNLSTASELVRSMGVSRIRVYLNELRPNIRSIGISRWAWRG